MDFTIRKLTPEERHLTYSHDGEFDREYGCIVHMRGDYDRGNTFFRTYWDHDRSLATPEFIKEFDQLIDQLFDKTWKTRNQLLSYCRENAFLFPESQDYGRDIFGLRVDTAKYIYMLRLTPYRGEYDVYCYCYQNK